MKKTAWLRCGLGLFVPLFLAGCSSTLKPTPTFDRYEFIKQDETFGQYYDMVYNPYLPREHHLSACITSPVGYTIKIHGSGSQSLGPETQETTLGFPIGVYPFQLTADDTKETQYCGALMVYDVDETLALATFGRSSETQLFSEEILNQARQGILAEYTISFDERPVLSYWMGNRSNPYVGGVPTVELDFSNIAGLEAVRVNGKKVDHRATLPVYTQESYSEYRRALETASEYVPDPVKADHEILLIMTDGRKYRGYVKNLTANAFTAFVSVPCDIPESLFTAASRGTVSRFTVNSTEKDESGATIEGDLVCEIVFGVDKGK